MEDPHSRGLLRDGIDSETKRLLFENNEWLLTIKEDT
jgi:hypothetical protein